MAEERYFASIHAEGNSTQVRGKIPGPLVAALGCKSGGAIEFIVRNGELKGAEVYSPKEAAAYRKERDSERRATRKTTAPAKKKKVVKESVPAPKTKSKAGKTKSKAAPAPAPKSKSVASTKKTKNAVSSSKRKTKVSYEEPKNTGTKKKKKLSFKRK